jgi:hypothetical protein
MRWRQDPAEVREMAAKLCREDAPEGISQSECRKNGRDVGLMRDSLEEAAIRNRFARV